ncbi:MAG: helix-turn-helix domain-containing protein [Erythrobacter sp.]
MSIEPTRSRTNLVQQTGSYRAWELAGGEGLADLAWHCRVGHDAPEAHRLLPFCEPSLVLLRRFDRAGRTQHCQLRIAPSQYDGGAYAPVPGEEQFALRLAPELMERSLGLRAAEHAGADAELPRAWRTAFDHALAAADRGNPQVVLTELLQGLARLSAERDADRVSYAARLLRQHPGGFSMTRLAELAGVTTRHLRREFALRFGLSPRGLSRRLRLASAMLEAECHERPSWAGIAAGHGFSDQSHMIRECRAILGQKPGEVFALRRALSRTCEEHGVVDMSASFNT